MREEKRRKCLHVTFSGSLIASLVYSSLANFKPPPASSEKTKSCSYSNSILFVSPPDSLDQGISLFG